MIKNTLKITSLLIAIWFAGLTFCLLHYGMGGSGTDALSEHYRFVISLLIK